MVAARVPFTWIGGDQAAYAFNFVAVIGAAVLAGWRSGLLALGFGQLLTWYFIVEPRWSLVLEDRDRAVALILATASQALILLVITLYQREVDKGVAERERRLELLEHARHEIDHRVRNNYQTVLSLVQLQMHRAADPGERQILRQVADRIKAVSLATDRLSLRGDDLGTVRLRDHLCELCKELERGLSREEISVHCEVPDIAENAIRATYLAIIVNELVTNALKHAFHDKTAGHVRVEAKPYRDGLELVVADNGSGIKRSRPSAGTGLGQKLVNTFVRQLGGKQEVESSEAGTIHRILVPSLG
jgi:two-component sensor histidine kinase